MDQFLHFIASPDYVSESNYFLTHHPQKENLFWFHLVYGILLSTGLQDC